ncbi:MAG TPA: hypothetical protein VJC39_00855 [Candidatus Nanoarchaeia archaeon]|nr:hypothetical protein [Candidatus Nanoarchaeia archaeon]
MGSRNYIASLGLAAMLSSGCEDLKINPDDGWYLKSIRRCENGKIILIPEEYYLQKKESAGPKYNLVCILDERGKNIYLIFDQTRVVKQ